MSKVTCPSGLKRGTRRGRVGLSERHALAIVNHGGATAAEVLDLARAIRDALQAMPDLGEKRKAIILGHSKGVVDTLEAPMDGQVEGQVAGDTVTPPGGDAPRRSRSRLLPLPFRGLRLPRRSRKAKPGSPPGLEPRDLSALPSVPGGARITCIDYSPEQFLVEEVEDGALVGLLDEIYECLRPGGVVLVIDYGHEAAELGDQGAQLAVHQVVAGAEERIRAVEEGGDCVRRVVGGDGQRDGVVRAQDLQELVGVGVHHRDVAGLVGHGGQHLELGQSVEGAFG